MPSPHIHARQPSEEVSHVIKGLWYPQMPPHLPHETLAPYTDRLAGVLGEDLCPYDHRRFRQCAIGWHEECTTLRSAPERFSGTEEAIPWTCECPCHRPATTPWADMVFVEMAHGTEGEVMRWALPPDDPRTKELTDILGAPDRTLR